MSNVNDENHFEGHYYEILPDDYAQYDLNFKIIVIGNSGVGKSSLTNKATKNIFIQDYNPTIGFEFFSFNIKLDNKIIKLQIWDTCGQELYRSLITNFYKNSALAIIVYSITDKRSFDDIELWLKEIKIHSNPDAKIFIIGNKIDLEDDRVISTEEGINLKNNFSCYYFNETSAKTGLNAREIFLKATICLYDDYIKYVSRTNSLSSSESFRQTLQGMKLKQNSEILTDGESEKVSQNSKNNKKGKCC